MKLLFISSLTLLLTILFEILKFKPSKLKRRRNSIIKNKKVTYLFEKHPETFTRHLQELEKFEKDKKYLNPKLTINIMAKTMRSNSAYVATLLKIHRHKNYIQYINDLRIDYIIEILKTSSRHRNYTNKALGSEAGFGTTQSFVKSFKNRTRKSPTDFIKRIHK